MPDGREETIRRLKQLFWQTMAKAEALRNVAATQRDEQEAARFLEKANLEEARAKDYLSQAEKLEQSDPDHKHP
jgi:hypothetical protein